VGDRSLPAQRPDTVASTDLPGRAPPTLVDTVDAQGNFLGEQLIEHGPHQFAGDFGAYCDAIAAAIG
jgi:hypothetical protein